MPSASRLKLSTEIPSKRPGNSAIHQATSMASWPAPIMLPHDGVGGRIPMPRKDSPASAVIIPPTIIAALTRTGVIALGIR